MQTKYVAGSLLAVILTAMVLGTAASGLMIASHSIAAVEQRQPAVNGGIGFGRSLAPATGNLIVSVSWCSDSTAVYCVPIGGATVLVTTQAGTFVATSLTNAKGQATFSVSSPVMYKVDVDVQNVSAFGYLASHSYSMMQTVTGGSVNAVFQYDQPGANPW